MTWTFTCDTKTPPRVGRKVCTWLSQVAARHVPNHDRGSLDNTIHPDTSREARGSSPWTKELAYTFLDELYTCLHPLWVTVTATNTVNVDDDEDSDARCP